MRLVITTPTALAVDEAEVESVRAADETGSFGVLRGHADFLTALGETVVTWRTAGGATRHCAVRGGVFTVTGGARVSIATPEAVRGDDLQHLQREVVRAFRRAAAEEASARTEADRLHLGAIRRILEYLRPAGAREG